MLFSTRSPERPKNHHKTQHQILIQNVRDKGKRLRLVFVEIQKEFKLSAKNPNYKLVISYFLYLFELNVIRRIHLATVKVKIKHACS